MYAICYASEKWQLPMCIQEIINLERIVWVSTPMSLATSKHHFSLSYWVTHKFQRQSYLNPFVLGAYDSPAPPTGPAPDGWDVEDAGLQGPPQDMFPTDRGLLGYGEYTEEGVLLPEARPWAWKLGLLAWPAEKECRDRLGMGPVVLLWLRHCWQVHAGPEWITELVAKGYGALAWRRTCRLKPEVLFTWASAVRSTM